MELLYGETLVNEQECLVRMIAPGQPRPKKSHGGVIQIHVTRACDKCCYDCTQGSNLAGKPGLMTVEQFEQALQSLRGYFGVVGVFGGNPALHPDFLALCELARKHVPFERRGLWCNNPISVKNAQAMRATFNPAVSNLNVHLDAQAFDLFKTHWPESRPFGLRRDSRHSPPFASMVDLGIPEAERWEKISRCDINQHWSALISVFRGQLRAWFCEIAGAQAMLHQYDPDYPDTGFPIDAAAPVAWWKNPMTAFLNQVRQHCHHCSIPLRGYGHLSQQDDGAPEQTSHYHRDVFRSKRRRPLQLVTAREQLHPDGVNRVIDYLNNGKI